MTFSVWKLTRAASCSGLRKRYRFRTLSKNLVRSPTLHFTCPLSVVCTTCFATNYIHIAWQSAN